MLYVYSAQENVFQFIGRFNIINKFKIIDHTTNDEYEEDVYILGNQNKFIHSGITYDFKKNNLYTYLSYYVSGETYLNSQSLIRSDYIEEERFNSFNTINKPKNKFYTR